MTAYVDARRGKATSERKRFEKINRNAEQPNHAERAEKHAMQERDERRIERAERRERRRGQ